MMGFELPAPTQVIALILTVVLCGLIGFEREYLRHDAGIRTHILVGLGSCLFTLVSLYGINAAAGNFSWDASRIAAGVVSGIGFIGAGVIFLNHDAVRGLTTSSAIWIAAAVGVTCGVNMFSIAILAVVLYFVAIFIISPIVKWILCNRQNTGLQIVYEDGHGSLRATLLQATQMGFETRVLSSHEISKNEWHGAVVTINLLGKGDISDLIEEINKTDGVSEVEVLDNEG